VQCEVRSAHLILPPPSELTHANQEHWKYGGHKKACAAYVLAAAAAAQAQQDRLCKRAAETEQCLVCLEAPPYESVEHSSADHGEND